MLFTGILPFLLESPAQGAFWKHLMLPAGYSGGLTLLVSLFLVIRICDPKTGVKFVTSSVYSAHLGT